MNPTIGRIVHIAMEDGTVTAAIITGIEPVETDEPRTTVSVIMFSIVGLAILRFVPYSEAYAVNCWSWPPRV
jgi:hypothetical protein